MLKLCDCETYLSWGVLDLPSGVFALCCSGLGSFFGVENSSTDSMVDSFTGVLTSEKEYIPYFFFQIIFIIFKIIFWGSIIFFDCFFCIWLLVTIGPIFSRCAFYEMIIRCSKIILGLLILKKRISKSTFTLLFFNLFISITPAGFTKVITLTKV